MTSYFGSLMLHLAAGVEALDVGLRRRQAEFFRRRQTADGGFAGREGPGDLYYTNFALRGLALLGELDETVAAQAASFLQGELGRRLPSVDFFSLVDAAVLLELSDGVDVFAAAGIDREAAVAATLEPLRRGDGGYAKTPASGYASTYHTFLALSSRQLVGLAPEEPERTAAMIRSRQQTDGGFVELAQLRAGGTNPTAAAVGTLRLLDALDETVRAGAAAFLASMQSAEGGWRANTRIPVADLLSTFTGLVALADLDALPAIDLSAARRYVASLEFPDGGFRGGAWDDTADVEYTFYGLASLALLHAFAS